MTRLLIIGAVAGAAGLLAPSLLVAKRIIPGGDVQNTAVAVAAGALAAVILSKLV